MPIADLSEDIRMPRVGKLYLGKKDPKDGHPIKTEFFVIRDDHPNREKFVELFTKEPKTIRIMIPSENTEDWAPQYYKAYDMTHGLVCKGDGKKATRMVDIKTGKFPTKDTDTVKDLELDCLGKDCEYHQSKKCRETMNLRFLIPEIPGLGIWEVRTGSINSILNINSSAALIKTTFGRLTSVPLNLTLEPAIVNQPGSKRKQTVYVLNLRTNVSLLQLAEMAKDQRRRFMIETPDIEEAYMEQVKKNEALWGDGNPDHVDQSIKEVGIGHPAPSVPPKTETPKPVAASESAVKTPDVEEDDKLSKNKDEKTRDERKITVSEKNDLMDLISSKGLNMTEVGDIMSKKLKWFPCPREIKDFKKWQYDDFTKYIKDLK